MNNDNADTIRHTLNLVVSYDRASALWEPAESSLVSLDALVAENQQLRAALLAMREVATVSYEGDPWYCENQGIDVGKAFELAQAALELA